MATNGNDSDKGQGQEQHRGPHVADDNKGGQQRSVKDTGGNRSDLAATTETGRWQCYAKRVAADPWQAPAILSLTRRRQGDGDGDEWIAKAAAVLWAMCMHPTLAPQGSRRRTDRVRAQKEDAYRWVLDRLGIPRGDGVCGCVSALADLVAMWEALDADLDAAMIARAYLADWPPSRSALGSFLGEMSRACFSRDSTIRRHRAIVSDTSSPSAVLVGALGDTARRAARTRATAEEEWFQNATAVAGHAAAGDARYLILCRPALGHYDMAILVSIARGQTADGTGAILGRMYRRKARTPIDGLPAPLPAPKPECLPPRLRPYAGFIPALLFVILDQCAERDRDRDTDDEEEYRSWRETMCDDGSEHNNSDDDDDDEDSDAQSFWADQIKDEDFSSRYPDHWLRAPLTAVCSLMEPLYCPADIPPRVIETHMPMDGPVNDCRHAWLDECALERFLSIAASQHALRVFCMVRARYGYLADMDARNRDDGDNNDEIGHHSERGEEPSGDDHDDDDDHENEDAMIDDNAIIAQDDDRLADIANDTGNDSVNSNGGGDQDNGEGGNNNLQGHGHQHSDCAQYYYEIRKRRPPRSETLLSQARHAIARGRARIPLLAAGLLPVEIADPLALDIWLVECERIAHAGDNNLYTHAPQNAERLHDVARYWGVEPTAAQMQSPRLLCGALAGQAVTRAMRGGERFDPASVARVGPPMLTAAEEDAAADTYTAPRGRRFAWTPDVVDLVHGAVGADPWLDDVTGDTPFDDDDAIVRRACAIVAEANERYNVKPDPTQDDANPRTSAPRSDIETRVQAVLAIAALRSGLAVSAADLADAGSVAALLAPLDALFP
nr:hypothetical protein [Pandoravirus belohorizontensis]